MNNLSIFLISTLLVSCGFSSSENSEIDSPKAEIAKVKLEDNQDFDGDMISNGTERESGSNPLVADLPKLKVNFLQDYKITVSYRRLSDGVEGSFVIDTKVHRNDPGFKYRVGSLFIRDEAIKNAASVAKFSGHSWGEITEHDLSWVSYPEIDSKVFLLEQQKYLKYFDANLYEITNTEIELESSAKLLENLGFSEIKGLSLNFYYYDYERESYELVKNTIVERNFRAGINETFKVVIENPPQNLLFENYFKKGELIISEVGDFEIPSLKTTYKGLLSSVKAKSLPVIYTSPSDIETYYVGTGENGKRLTEVLESIFDKKFIIRENLLSKINQFENNLPDFKYLSEIKEENKKGKWFIFTNKLDRHYIDHQYKPGDVLSLSYVLGSELAQQNNEKILSYRESASSNTDAAFYPLGNVTTNTQISFQLSPVRKWGQEIKQWSDVLRSDGGSCGRNCINREFKCFLDFNIISDVDQSLTFNQSIGSELQRVSLIINQSEYLLSDLIEKKLIQTYWLEGNLHVEIEDIGGIQKISEIDENLLTLKIKPSLETVFNGVKLSNWSGPDWMTCLQIVPGIAGSNNWPLSTESREFGAWQGNVNWNLVKRGDSRQIGKHFSIGISSIITNRFN